MNHRFFAGLGFLLAIGLTARLLSTALPVNHLIITVLLGLLIGNLYGIPAWAQTAVETHTLWLELGIVVMGASVALDRIFEAGSVIILLVIITVVATTLLIEFLARAVFTIHEETGSLLAAGSGICGVSAVVAVAESITADESRIAYAAATVIIFDAMTLFIYPLVGHALELSNTVFGIWAGLTMFSTGPVAAAGFAFSDTAGQWALLAKLTRNSLIGFVAVVYAFSYAQKTSSGTSGATKHGDTTLSHTVQWKFLWRSFPKFVLGFVGMIAVANTGLLTSRQLTSLSHLSDWAFLLAFAGLGLEIQLADFRSTGYRPIVVVFTGWVVVASVMLLVVQILF